MICGELTNYKQVYKLAKNVSVNILGGVTDVTSLKSFIQKTLDQVKDEYGQHANKDHIIKGIEEFVKRLEIINQVPLNEILDITNNLWNPNSDIIPTMEEMKSPHENGVSESIDNEAPGIERFYTNNKHREIFRKNFQNDLIRSVFINESENYLVTDDLQLNASIKALKNKIAKEKKIHSKLI